MNDFNKPDHEAVEARENVMSTAKTTTSTNSWEKRRGEHVNALAVAFQRDHWAYAHDTLSMVREEAKREAVAYLFNDPDCMLLTQEEATKIVLEGSNEE